MRRLFFFSFSSEWQHPVSLLFSGVFTSPATVYYKGPSIDLSAWIKQDGIIPLTQGVKINQYELWWTLTQHIYSTRLWLSSGGSLQFKCWHFYERLWFMDLILSQISKSYVTRLVYNKMLISSSVSQYMLQYTLQIVSLPLVYLCNDAVCICISFGF